jgi:hypothetical protein
MQGNLLHRLADYLAQGWTEAQICLQLGLSRKMYGWLTENDGFQLALEKARERHAEKVPQRVLREREAAQAAGMDDKNLDVGGSDALD